MSKSRGMNGKVITKAEELERGNVPRREIMLGWAAALRIRISRWGLCGGWDWEGVVTLRAMGWLVVGSVER